MIKFLSYQTSERGKRVKKKNKRQLLRKKGLFNNNKFVCIFSIVCAFVIWIIISSTSQEEMVANITNIPVSIELSDEAKEEGLMVFGADDLKAEVSISGSRIIIGSITSSDIEIVAQASSITMPGNYPIQLTAKKVGLKTDYEIASNVTPSFVTVMVDRNREIELDVKNLVQYSIDSNYYAPTPTISEPKITVSGPETVISKIDHVAAVGTINGNLTETASINAQLVFYDSYGEVITNEYIVSSVSEVIVTVSVLSKRTLPLTVNITNKPEEFDIKDWITVEPAYIDVAATNTVFEELTEINLGTIDLSTVTYNNSKYIFDIILPVGCKNLSNEYETATVTFDTSKMFQKTFLLENFKIKNIPQGKTAECTTVKMYVNLVGPEKDILALEDGQISAEIDISNMSENTGHTEVPVNIIINNNKTCWAYGQYTADIIIADEPE